MLASGTARWSLHQSCLLEASSDKIERLTSLENLFCCSKPPSNTQPADIVGDKGSKRSDSFLFCLNIPSSLCLAEVMFAIGKINGVYFAVKKFSILISTTNNIVNVQSHVTGSVRILHNQEYLSPDPPPHTHTL